MKAKNVGLGALGVLLICGFWASFIWGPVAIPATLLLVVVVLALTQR